MQGRDSNVFGFTVANMLVAGQRCLSTRLSDGRTICRVDITICVLQSRASQRHSYWGDNVVILVSSAMVLTSHHSTLHKPCAISLSSCTSKHTWWLPEGKR